MYNCTYRLKTMTYPQQPKTEGQKLSSWFMGFFSDRRVVCLISRLIAVIDQSRSFWRSCQSRNLVRLSVDWSNQSRSLRKEFKTRGFALIQLTTWKRRHYFHIFFLAKNDWNIVSLCNLKMKTLKIFII